MDDKKISFITCVNKDDVYKEALFYIHSLDLPDGFTYDCIAVRGAKSMTEGYNAGMRQSDARYKVYLHQDVHIVETYALRRMLDIFGQDPDIRAMGMAGALDLAADGNWVHAPRVYGGVYQTSPQGRTFLNSFCDGAPPADGRAYYEAAMLDGLLIATQTDLPWREDLFGGWHFYDISQSCEFLRMGYKLAIPSPFEGGQERPWCVHYGDNGMADETWNRARGVFLGEYRDMLPPLDAQP